MTNEGRATITQIEVNGIKYSNTRPNYYYRLTENGTWKRISKAEWEKAFDEYTADAEWDIEDEVEARKEEEERKMAESDKEAEDAFNKCGDGTPFSEVGKQIAKAAKAKAKKASRKSKDIAYTTRGLATEITLTSKQVDFIKHIPDTCFYEDGLDSTPWCDVLADEIGGQFANKPMTVGAMISTLREKNLIYVGTDRINGKKAKFFGFTEIGRAVASELGLN